MGDLPVRLLEGQAVRAGAVLLSSAGISSTPVEVAGRKVTPEFRFVSRMATELDHGAQAQVSVVLENAVEPAQYGYTRCINVVNASLIDATTQNGAFIGTPSLLAWSRNDFVAGSPSC
jgi:hypothetical protein